MSKDPAILRALRRVGDWVLAADRFVRLHYLFFTCVWPLLGAASLGRDFTVGEISGLLAVIVCFHVYAFLLNDIMDLPIDRTHPNRQNDPLVRGVVRPSQTLLVALVQPALAVPLTMWLGGTWQAHATLAAGFLFMTVYNVWGKRCRFPPLTDAIQGLGWGSLAVYAPCALGAEPNALAWMVAAYVAVFTLLFNGVHGDLRDLANDLAGTFTSPERWWRTPHWWLRCSSGSTVPSCCAMTLRMDRSR
jgi:4-hydroxybenzoate polyprenyltransferase